MTGDATPSGTPLGSSDGRNLDKEAPVRLPKAGFLAAVVALAGLFVTSGGSLLIPILALGLAATYITDVRLPVGTWALWIIRIAGAFLAALAGSAVNSRGTDLFVSAPAIDWFGQLCGVELLLRCWVREKPGTPLMTASTMLSGLILLCASNTSDSSLIQYLAPAFLTLTILSMRQRLSGSTGATRRRLPLLNAVFILLALGIGQGIAGTINHFRGDLTSWANDLIFGALGQESTGMGRSPSLGRNFDLRGGVERALRLETERVAGAAAKRPEPQHLRGVTYWVYGRGRWGPPGSQRELRPMSAEKLRPGVVGERVRVTRFIRNNGLIFAPLDSAGIDPLANEDLNWDSGSGAPLRSATPDPYVFATSATHAMPGVLASAPKPEDLPNYTRLPRGIDLGVYQIAHQIRGEERDPERLAQRVIAFLGENNRYSLSARIGEGEQVSRFILDKKAAHCEYFASSAVILLRIMKVPARYVTGYYAHEPGDAGTLVVRQRDAHAWAEVWNGRRWITVEATPPSGLPDALADEVPLHIRTWERIQDFFGRLPDWLNSAEGQRVVLIAGGLVLVAAVVVAWRGLQRRRSPADAWRYTLPAPDLAVLGARFDALLQRRGVACPEPQTWLEHLSALDDASNPPPDLDAMRRFVDCYNDARFGSASHRMQEMNELLAQLERGPAAAIAAR